ncbi:hypothetical protein SH501x_000308 [Pirellulaceae bacterium SH501]
MALETPSKPTSGLIQSLRMLAMVSVGMLISYEASGKAWSGYCEYRESNNLVHLNELVKIYSDTVGNKPDPNLINLYRHGLTSSRLHPTPYGGYYRFDPRAGVVYNPNR